MKALPTIERLRELLAYDPETGALSWRVRTSNAKAGWVAGSLSGCGYLQVKVDGRVLIAHRAVWAIVHGTWPRGQIDHINGVRTDNRIANLRDVPRSVNQQNQRRARSDNKAGFLGVSPSRDRFLASIQIDGLKKFLGYFTTAEEAHQAYLTAKRQHHEGCTI